MYSRKPHSFVWIKARVRPLILSIHTTQQYPVSSALNRPLKGLFAEYYMGCLETSSGIRFTLSVFHFFFPCVRYGRFHGQSNLAFTVTGEPIWTDLWHHQIDRSGHRVRNNDKRLKKDRRKNMKYRDTNILLQNAQEVLSICIFDCTWKTVQYFLDIQYSIAFG